MVYRLALGTGFRANELRSLTPASFDLQADPPTVTVAAAYTKRRRQDVQPIRSGSGRVAAGMAGRIALGRAVVRNCPTTRPRCFAGPAGGPGGMDRGSHDGRGTAAAGRIATSCGIEDADGRSCSTSTRRGTRTSRASWPRGHRSRRPRNWPGIQRPVLTIGRYSHARLHDLTGALEALPGSAALGTRPAGPAGDGDGRKGRLSMRGTIAGAVRRQNVQNGAKRGERGPAQETTTPIVAKVLTMNTLGDNRRNVTAEHPLAESNRCCRTENPES